MGQSASAEFDKQLDDICARPVALDEHATWNALFSSKIESFEIPLRFKPYGVRCIRMYAPANLATLLYKCIEQVHRLSDGNTVPTADKVLGATIAVSLLGRLVPMLLEPLDVGLEASRAYLEARRDGGDKVEEIEMNRIHPQSADFADLFFREGRRFDDADGVFPPLVEGQALGETMVDAVVRAACTPGFCVSPSATGRDKVPHYRDVESGRMWAPGVADLATPPRFTNDEASMARRLRTVRALLGFLCGQVFERWPFHQDILRRRLVSRQTPFVRTLVASFVASITSYTPRGWLPYTSNWVWTQESTVVRSAELLCLMLDYPVFYTGDQLAASRQAFLGDAADGKVMPKGAFVGDLSQHAAWSVLLDLTPKDAREFVTSLVGYLDNLVQKDNVWLPGSQREIPGSDYYFALMTIVIERCPNIRDALFDDKALVRRIVLPALTFAHKGLERNDAKPQLQLGLRLLAVLSAHRDAVVALNHPFNEWVPIPLQAFTGTYMDLLLIGLHAIFTANKAWVKDLQPRAVLAMRNVAPFATSLSPVAAAKLAGLLTHVADRRWLLQDKAHVANLETFVAALASIIGYQPTSAQALVYALVESRKGLTKLQAAASDPSAHGLPDAFADSTAVRTVLSGAHSAERELTVLARDNPHTESLELMKQVSLVGKIPAPAEIKITPFHPGERGDAWMVQFLWINVFAYNKPQIVDVKTVRVFKPASYL